MRIQKPLVLVLGLAAAACASRTTASSRPSFSDNEFSNSSSSFEDRSVQNGSFESRSSVTVTQQPAPIVTYSPQTYTVQQNPPRGSVQDIIRQYDNMPTEYFPDRTEIQSDGTYRR